MGSVDSTDSMYSIDSRDSMNISGFHGLHDYPWDPWNPFVSNFKWGSDLPLVVMQSFSKHDYGQAAQKRKAEEQKGKQDFGGDASDRESQPATPLARYGTKFLTGHVYNHG